MQKSTEMTYPIKIQEAIEKISCLYCELVENISALIINNEEIKTSPQDDTQATYSLWRNEDDYRIDWTKNADYIKRFIDATGYPYAGASTHNGKEKLRIIDAEIIPDVKIENRDVGKIIFMEDNKPVVVCGQGLLKLNKVLFDKSNTNALPFKNFRVKLFKKKSYVFKKYYKKS